MMNKLFLPCAIAFAFAQAISANDEDTRVVINKPPLHPVEQKVVPDTFVPEFGYYFTKKASQENIILGPCSPCVCMQICNPKNDECLYVHQHHQNDPLESIKKVREHFTLPENTNKPELDVTLFTNTDPTHIQEFNFAEGSHKKRIMKLAESIEQDSTVQKKAVYYNESPEAENLKNGFSACTVLFKDKKPYGVNVTAQEGIKDLDAHKDFRLFTYLDLKLRKKFADRVYASKQNSIWRKGDNPLFQIKKPNIVTINNLPPSTEYPCTRYKDLPREKPVTTLGADWAYCLYS